MVSPLKEDNTMKRQVLLLVIVSIITFMFSRIPANAQGVRFREPKDWKALLRMAREENKDIFLDIYATWCAPCKQMDEGVYSLESVGHVMNKQFVSVKLQLDSTGRESAFIREWRKSVKLLQKEYQITSMPTFLFLDKNGEGLHKEVGFKDETRFIKMVSDARDPSQQFYVLLKKYQSDYLIAPKLIAKANEFGEKEVSQKVAREYINAYLAKLPKEKLLSKENLQLMSDYLTWKEMGILGIILSYRREVDSLMDTKNFSENLAENLLRSKYKEGLSTSQEKPKWDKIGDELGMSYSNYGISVEKAKVALLWIKAEYYRENKMDNEYVSTIWQVWDLVPPKHGPFGDARVNNFCYNTVFKKIERKDLLANAIKWMEWLVVEGPVNEEQPDIDILNRHDTYANLLYKYGRTKEAVELQRRIVVLGNKLPDIQKNGREAILKDFSENLFKMEHGMPTWK